MFKLPTEGQKLTRLVLWLMGKATAQDAQCEIQLVYFQSSFPLMAVEMDQVQATAPMWKNWKKLLAPTFGLPQI